MLKCNFSGAKILSVRNVTSCFITILLWLWGFVSTSLRCQTKLPILCYKRSSGPSNTQHSDVAVKKKSGWLCTFCPEKWVWTVLILFLRLSLKTFCIFIWLLQWKLCRVLYILLPLLPTDCKMIRTTNYKADRRQQTLVGMLFRSPQVSGQAFCV